MQKLNVHFYDGKLKERLSFISKDAENIPLAQKLQSYDTLWSKCDVTPVAKSVYSTLIQDIKKGKNYANNYDSTNDFYIEDLLYMCCVISETYDPDIDFYKLFTIQLEEMRSGMCAQGRACRLLQIILSYVPS